MTTGPSLAVLGTAEGNAVAREQGAAFFLHVDVPVVDTTGAGDALVAGVVAGLARALPSPIAAARGIAAAALTVQRLGGRPALSPAAVDQVAAAVHPTVRC